jgi:putrescine transport system substrate-binding protein
MNKRPGAGLPRCMIALIVALGIAGCSKKEDSTVQSSAPTQTSAASSEEKVLNVYNWSDYIAENTISDFEKETGIKVRYDVYDSNETLEGKLLAGNSGYDIVVPSANFLEKQIKAGIYRTIDKSKIPNLKNMNPDIMQRLALHDPDNAHAVNYMWGTTGIGYNVDKVAKAMPGAPTDSWHLVFDPAVVKNFKSCGVAVLDSASEMTDMVLAYLGKDPNSQNPADLKLVESTLLSIRPYIKYIQSSQYIADLASGEICIAVGYSGDILQARDRAKENNTGAKIAYSVPKEGTIIWFDSLAIPKDAPHPDNAHLFIDYLMRPDVIANVSNTTNYANGNAAATPLVKESVRNDPGVYPPPEIKSKLFPNLADTEEFSRLENRTWTRFATGK